MNEFRSQLQSQAATFVSRDMFDTYVKENVVSRDQSHTYIGEKYDALLAALNEKHDRDIALFRSEIQEEREVRKRFEGSINTWKWIVGFLGASGVGGVILLFITNTVK